MSLLITVAAAAEVANPLADTISLFISSVVSATVFSSTVTGLATYIVNRRNSRIVERKNAVDAESDIVARYREQASEERAQKESAVKTIRDLLSESKDQVAALKGTVETLTKTITLLENLTTSQNDMISRLTHDRNRTQEALERAEARIVTQTEELRRRQKEITELLAQTRSREEAEKIVTDTFDIS